jgi:hypothetical protein
MIRENASNILLKGGISWPNLLVSSFPKYSLFLNEWLFYTCIFKWMVIYVLRCNETIHIQYQKFCLSVSLFLYTHTQKEREREREREKQNKMNSQFHKIVYHFWRISFLSLSFYVVECHHKVFSILSVEIATRVQCHYGKQNLLYGHAFQCISSSICPRKNDLSSKNNTSALLCSACYPEARTLLD